MDARERFRGCLLGLAIGDAVGTTLEFKPPGTFKPSTDLVGGGPFNLKAGEWTDDTSMSLCLAESLTQLNAFDLRDQLQRYVRWWKHGHLSSNGVCFDIGNTTRAALAHFTQTGDAYSGATTSTSAGNGSLMRLAPVPMFYANQPALAIEQSGESSRSTHGAAEAVDACRFFGGLLCGALGAVDKSTLLSPHFCPIENYWQFHALAPKIDAIAAGSYKTAEAPTSNLVSGIVQSVSASLLKRTSNRIQGSGYVVKSLEAALWAFHHSTNFRDGCLLAVNLGDDADTTGAIYGQIAGAYYGESGIPTEWRAKLAKRQLIEDFANKLFAIYQEPPPAGLVTREP